MQFRSMAVGLMCGAVLLATGCSGEAPAPPNPPAPPSSVPRSSSAPTSAPASASPAENPPSSTPRPPIPDAKPADFEPADLSRTYNFGYILSYANKYPGWIMLTADAPKYDEANSGYRVHVYFNAYGGHDNILRAEWSLAVGGKKTVASVSPVVTDQYSLDQWLPERTPIGNVAGATSNALVADILFKMPKTSQPITMHYDNMDGDVHATWQAGGYGS